MSKCPHCGKSINQSYAFENRVRRPFKNDALAPTFPQGGLTTEQPTGLPSMESHVRIPFRQTVIFGLLDAPIGLAIGLGAGLSVAMLADAASGDSFTLAAYTLITGAGGAIGGTVSFCRAAKAEWPKRLNVYDALLWVEEVTGWDLDGDGEVGEPETNVLRIELHDQQGRPRLIADLDTDQERFAEFARLVVALDMGFCEEVAKKAGYPRKEWVKIRDTFIELKAAAWKNEKNHKEGCYLRGSGYDLFNKVLPPPPPGSDAPKNVSGTVERTRTNGLNGRFEHIER